MFSLDNLPFVFFSEICCVLITNTSLKVLLKVRNTSYTGVRSTASAAACSWLENIEASLRFSNLNRKKKNRGI